VARPESPFTDPSILISPPAPGIPVTDYLSDILDVLGEIRDHLWAIRNAMEANRG